MPTTPASVFEALAIGITEGFLPIIGEDLMRSNFLTAVAFEMAAESQK